MTDRALDFRLLFEASPDVLLVLLPDAPRYTMVAATRTRLEVTHTTLEETIGRGLFELFPDNPDDAAATGASNLRASLERVLATRAPDTMAVQKYDIRGPDGTFQTRYWSPRNLPVLSASGEVLYILHRVEDVTELVRASEAGEELRGRTREMEREVVHRSRELAAANRELRDANAKLGELDAVKTAFFHNVSHEFRTPLTLMLGPLEDALGDGAEPLGPRQRVRFQVAHDNALRLLKLVNALLDFSRLEAGRLRASYAPTDLAAFTAELAGMFRSAAETAGLRLVIECPPLPEPVWVDREMWEKIVPNLVSNAFKFTLGGEIGVRVREEPTHVLLEVADTGVGIPEAELPRIFERFHRVVGRVGRTHEGTGIGLALVRELVELHGGRVTVESQVGRGTTFRVEIPRGFAHLPAEAVSHTPADQQAGRDSAAHAAEAMRWVGGGASASADTPAPAASQAPGGPRACVLVVDDNADLRGYIGGLLSPSYDVASAADGLEALAAIRQRLPDIVVSDVMMPRLDGFGLVRELRADTATASVPVILLSARAGEEASIAGLDAGSDDYLVKPFSARELLARVRTHVELSRARRAWIAELERANRELDAFAYSVSHDLRSPLRAVQGFASSLAEDHADRLPAEGRKLLDDVIRCANRMGELIEDLLRLSRLGRQPLSKRAVKTSALVAEVLEELRRDQDLQRVQVVVTTLPDVVADPSLLKQVFLNLLSNAFKFTRHQERPLVEVASTPGNGETVFYVRDNGAGFDMQYAARLFGVFQRLHRQDEFEGTGVGLSIVSRILQRHGGRVWAEGAAGRGATFSFSLPSEHT
jgi:signal transduction histidine kinase